MLYTVVPMEEIYRSNDQDNNPTSRELMEYQEISLENGRVIARREGDDYYIEKVISTSMEDYLKESLYPGTKVY